MPRAVNGIYSLPSGNPVVSGTLITSAWANTTMSDMAQEVTNSLDRSGRGGMLAALRGIDGLVNAPMFSFTNEPTSGVYRPSTGRLAMSIAGNEMTRWTSTGVKIGAASDPTDKLDVAGNGVFSGSASAGVRASTTITASGGTQAAFEARGVNSDAGSAAFMSFHRPGQYAVNFGLDTDNKLKVGGWSMGAVAREIWHEGNMPANDLWSWRGATANPNDLTYQTPGPGGDLRMGSYRWERGSFSDHVIQSYAGGSTSHVQMSFHYGSQMQIRTRRDGTAWDGWVNVWTSGNFDPANYYTVAQTETRLNDVVGFTSAAYPTKIGGGASGTWNINVTGSAGSANFVNWSDVGGRPSAVSSFTNDSGYVPTSFFTSNRSLSSSGYQYLPGGLLMQWTQVSMGDISGAVTGNPGSISWPVTFGTAILQCFATVRDTSGAASNGSISVCVTGFSQSGATFVVNEDNNAVQSAWVHLFAIGF